MGAKRRRAAKDRAVWERGYNGHVYWQGGMKLGKVTRHTEKSAAHKYTWEAAGRTGAADALEAARRAVELAVAVADKQMDLFD